MVLSEGMRLLLLHTFVQALYLLRSPQCTDLWHLRILTHNDVAAAMPVLV